MIQSYNRTLESGPSYTPNLGGHKLALPEFLYISDMLLHFDARTTAIENSGHISPFLIAVEFGKERANV